MYCLSYSFFYNQKQARAITPKTGKTWLASPNKTNWVQIQKYRRSYERFSQKNGLIILTTKSGSRCTDSIHGWSDNCSKGQVWSGGHMCFEALAFESLKTLYLEWSPPPVTVINKNMIILVVTIASWGWKVDQTYTTK